MKYYQAFGLTLKSLLAFPELPESEGPEDVYLYAAPEGGMGPGGVRGFFVEGGRASIAHPALGSVCVEAGEKIAFSPASFADERFLRMFLLGPAMAMLLHQRGCLVLHASAVAIDGKAIVFVGEKGRGKSTLTTALYECGYEFLTDDVAALDVGESITIRPSVPLAKVDPDALEALKVSGETRFALGGEIPKVGRVMAERVTSASLPVHCIFSLRFGAGPSLVRLSPQQAFAELLRHTFAARWLSGQKPDPLHFSRAASLVNRIPLIMLERPKKFSAMNETLHLLLETV